METAIDCLISFTDCRIGPAEAPVLRHFDWAVRRGEAWVVTGANGSGKSALAAALAGTLPVAPETPAEVRLPIPARLPPPGSVALVSFEYQRDMIFAERSRDDSEFVEGGVDEGTTARRFILRGIDGGRLPELAAGLGIGALLDRGIKFLSTGEIRKVALCRDLLMAPAVLVADELFEGLDQAARAYVSAYLSGLVSQGRTTLILVSDRYEFLPSGMSHVLELVDGRVGFCGSRADFELRRLDPSGVAGGAAGSAMPSAILASGLLVETASDAGPEQPGPLPEVLVELRDVTVSWSGRRVLDGLNFRLERGRHTLVRGPNGCGKTTLLNLISGDNPQAYANDVTVFGLRRGTGESVWDIKRRIGLVSYQLHLEYLYRCESSLLEVVISGFHDSIGLYEALGDHERRVARQWLEVLGMADRSAMPFTRLSYGEQRAVLIVRAVVKQPALLVLDEPCHGLDRGHRHQALAIAEWIGLHTQTTILHVTHDPAEYLACTRQILECGVDGVWRLCVPDAPSMAR